MWNQNRLTTLLAIEYPIIQAPMAGGPTTPELVSEVSNCGGLGMVGAGYLSVEQLKDQIRLIKERTRSPFGVNLFVVEPPVVTEQTIEESFCELAYFREKLDMSDDLPPMEDSSPLEEYIHIIAEEEVPVCSFTFGIPPQPLLSYLKERGIVVIGTATSVREAIAVEEAGMDAVVVQGSEAGGHRGTFLPSEGEGMVGTMALVPQVVDHVTIPVIASGGIMDGRGCAAAYMLGAEASQLGTVFLTTHESGAPDPHKKAILEATEVDTVITNAFSGKHARGIGNTFTHRMKDKQHHIAPYPIQNRLTKWIRKEAAKRGEAQYMSLWAGQGTRLNRVIHVRELMGQIVEETGKRLNGVE